jgi:antitoxin (DNA-binding transcriptional repressor) of toxin-antitoxin stability system
MNGLTTVDLTTARKNLSQLVHQIYMQDTSVVIAKHNIPLVKIVKVDVK